MSESTSPARASGIFARAYGRARASGGSASYGPLAPWLVTCLVVCLGAIGFLFVVSLWHSENGILHPAFTFANYREVFGEEVFRATIERTLVAGLLVVGTALLVAVPAAYYIAKVVRSPRRKAVILLLLALPFFVGPLVRVLALSGVLSLHGATNSLLQEFHLIHNPIEWLLYSRFAVFIGLLYNNFGLVLFASWLSFELVPDREIAAARDLGASPTAAFWRVTAPRAVPGIAAGVVLTFVPVAGALLEPERLAGNSGRFIGDVIGSQFLAVVDWPLGAALAVSFFVIIAPVVILLGLATATSLRLLARSGLRA